MQYWNTIPYKGNVVSDNGQWYKVKFEDNNEEELTRRGMIEFVQQDIT